VILSRFSDARIVIIGDVMLDRYIWGEVNRISPEAPVPVVAVKKITNVLGGAGNVASNLSSLGCQVELIGVSGDDEQSGLLNESLKLLKIDSGIMVDVNRRTITKTRIIAQKQQLLRMDEEAILSLSDDLKQKIVSLFRKSVVNADAVIVSDYGKGFFKTEGLCELNLLMGDPYPLGFPVHWNNFDFPV
jgi:D-beta-D-heptose 7-phosphate kinase/D-beta-D-heptose 1-phosphate adenosyltransferase